MRPRAASRSAGFTLVEILVTSLIMSMVMVSITIVLNRARVTRDEIHNIQERQLAGPAVLIRLENDLRGIFTFNRDPRGMLRIRDRVKSGYDADTIDFVTTVNGLIPYRENASDVFRHADVNEVGYHLRARPDSDDFLELYRREDFGVDDEPFADGNFALLHDRVTGFNIEVYDEDGPEAEPVDSWGTQDDEFVGLPARIDVELTIELAPRLLREQLVSDRRVMTYRRTFRFPEMQRQAAQEIQPVAWVPNLEPESEEVVGGAGGGAEPDAAGGGGGRDDETTATDDPFGGGGGGSGDAPNPFEQGAGGG